MGHMLCPPSGEHTWRFHTRGTETEEETEAKTHLEKESGVKTDCKYKLSADDASTVLRTQGYELKGPFACVLPRVTPRALRPLDTGPWEIRHESEAERTPRAAAHARPAAPCSGSRSEAQKTWVVVVTALHSCVVSGKGHNLSARESLVRGCRAAAVPPGPPSQLPAPLGRDRSGRAPIL